ncbi:MAG: hypothetical protein A2Y40_10625 [Candidatus Margulisbacteria bacterium GWF2_35_9]|nr:MAG: hypothetical protein A2Y40_10625 [Candidatus Margulisbacteria bacterium GWF2_35_9]
MVNFILNDSNPYDLESSHKQYTHDQDKSLHPKLTYKNTLRLLEETYPDNNYVLSEFTHDDDIYIFNFSDGFYNQRGKGITSSQSKASAIMEYVERFSWLNFDYKRAANYTKESFNSLSTTHNIKNIAKCFNLYDSPYKDELMELIKAIPLDWVQGYSLTSNSLTHYPVNWNNTYNSSNGLSAGNNKEEAISQGICEVIERHNLSHFILNYKESEIRFIDHQSIESTLVKELLSYYKNKNINILLIDASFPLEAPMVIACGIDPSPQKEVVRIGYGFGCHTDPEKAIIRAITEYTQGRKILLEKKELAKDFDFKTGQWQFRLNLDMDYIIKHAKVIKASSMPNIKDNDFQIEIQRLVDLFRHKSFELMIINKTHPKLNIPVYRVFSPDLYGVKEMHNVGKSEFFLIVQLYYHAGMISEAKAFYEKHFKSIIHSFNDMFPVIQHYLNKLSLGTKFNIDIFKNNLRPDSIPLSEACKENYIEALKATNHIMKKYDSVNKS